MALEYIVTQIDSEIVFVPDILGIKKESEKI